MALNFKSDTFLGKLSFISELQKIERLSIEDQSQCEKEWNLDLAGKWHQIGQGRNAVRPQMMNSKSKAKKSKHCIRSNYGFMVIQAIMKIRVGWPGIIFTGN